MPRPKINLYMEYYTKPVFKGIKCDYNSEYDYYSVDIDSLKNKISNLAIKIEWMYLERNAEKYVFINLYIAKENNRVSYKIIFEKEGNNRFYNHENIESILQDINIHYFGYKTLLCAIIDLNEIKPSNIIKNAYLNNTYTEKDGEILCFSHVTMAIDTYLNIKKNKKYFHLTFMFDNGK